MNYKAINASIISGVDVDDSVSKDSRFYKYLLNNKVAYYYSNNISKNSNKYEKSIIEKGNEYRSKYLASMKELTAIAEKHNIPFLVFKTHRYFDEVVDGDIDILVKERDFHKFLLVMKNYGYTSVEDEPLKGKCEKPGLLVIEPHVDISWKSRVYASGSKLWENSRVITYGGVHINCASSSTEMLAAAGELYYSPEYIDLFRIKTYQALSADAESGRMLEKDEMTKTYISCINRLIDDSSHVFPVFLTNTQLYSEVSSHLSFFQNMEIVLKNTYWRERYRVKKKLPFTHDWEV